VRTNSRHIPTFSMVVIQENIRARDCVATPYICSCPALVAYSFGGGWFPVLPVRKLVNRSRKLELKKSAEFPCSCAAATTYIAPLCMSISGLLRSANKDTSCAPTKIQTAFTCKLERQATIKRQCDSRVLLQLTAY
jgi:hypothetical protein